MFSSIAKLTIPVLALVLVLIGLNTSYHAYDASTRLADMLVIVTAVFFPFFVGSIILGIAVPQEQSAHIIVCERGLLQVRRKMKNNSIETVYWEDILPDSDTSYSGKYSLIYRDSKRFAFANNYQNFDELVTLIRQRGEKLS